LLVVLPGVALAQRRVTLAGFIEDAGSGERLANATLVEAGGRRGVAANGHGFFSLTLPAGEYRLVASHVGYAPDTLLIRLTRDTTVIARLRPATLLREVVVRPGGSSVGAPVAGRHDLAVEQIKAMPALLGETDLLKAIQRLPGVNGGTEGMSGVSVRGGSPEQTLVLLDGMPVYNVNHAFGYVSAFNGEALKGVTLLKGGVPARYGGRLSSVMEVTMKEGNNRRTGGAVTLSPLAGSVTLEGPIRRDRASFIVSGRRTWADGPLRLGQAIAKSEMPVTYGFHDLTGKVNWKVNERHHLFLSLYNGHDALRVKWKGEGTPGGYRYAWGNASVVGRWNWVVAPRLFSNTTLYYSRFYYTNETRQYRVASGSEDVARAYSSLADVTLKCDLDFLPGSDRRARFGVAFSRKSFAPEMAYLSDAGGDRSWRDRTSGSTWSAEAYVEEERRVSERWSASAGVRGTALVAGGARYYSLEPRLSVAWLVARETSIKGSFAMMRQPLHVLSNSSLEWRTDMWVPASEVTRPGESRLYSLGAYRAWSASGIEASVEVYYSALRRVIRYEEGVSYLKRKDESWEEHVHVGEGRAYGLEVMTRKSAGRWNGWIAYTWSRSTRRFPGIGENAWFPFEYDRRHKFNVVARHEPWRGGRGRWRKVVALDFTFASGNWTTIGTEVYLAAPMPGSVRGGRVPWRESREFIPLPNNARLPAYHHLDVAFHWINRRARGSSWSAGVYNVYARQNPGFYYRKMERDAVSYRQVSLLPFVPFVSWNYKF
jgi:hypothetical protein